MITIAVYNYWFKISVFDSFCIKSINKRLQISYLLLLICYYTILYKMTKANNDCLVNVNVSSLVKINKIFK